MKINLSVDIDWIEDDGSIDEHIKQELVLGVKNAISKTCLAKMEEQSAKAFETAVNEASVKITEKAMAFADEWLENEVTIHDKWGEPQETLTVRKLITNSFDNLLEKKVDSKGQFTNGYGDKTRLIDFLTNKKVEEEVSKRMKDFGKEIDERIQKSINQSIKDNVSDRFAQMVIGAAKQDYLDTKAIESAKQ